MHVSRSTCITLRFVVTACLLAGLFVASASGVDRATWIDNFDDGSISDWLIENPWKPGDDPVTIEVSSNHSVSPPHALHVHGPYAHDYSGRLMAAPPGIDLNQPYTISFMFRYKNAHWFHIVHFGHVVFLVDFPSLRPQTVTEDGWRFCGSSRFRDFCPPNRWTAFRFEVDPPNQRWDLYVDDIHRVSVEYGDYITSATGFRITETSGGPCQPDYISHAYYDNLVIQGWDAIDCNNNGIYDGTDIATGFDTDCNVNGIPDQCDINDGTSLDLDNNQLPDECQVDCNDNAVWDFEDIELGTVVDCNGNGVPDSCDIDDDEELDCNDDGIIDQCQIDAQTIEDCNSNGIPDSCDIATGSSQDQDLDGVPDECQVDCNNNGIPDIIEVFPDCDANGIPDECDIGFGTQDDCNNNGIPDECEILDLTADDCDGNGIPDDCDPDCNDDGIPDACEVLFFGAPDCNENLVPDDCDIDVYMTSTDLDLNGEPDECQEDCNDNQVPDVIEVLMDPMLDCNRNGIPDDCDIFVHATSPDDNFNGVPDECEIDCDGNLVYDFEDIGLGMAPDCNGNFVPDWCDLWIYLTSEDCNGNDIPDECDVADGFSPDCNDNLIPDDCELVLGLVTDCNANGIPDDCDQWTGFWRDCNANGILDDCDLLDGPSSDCNANGIPDECDIANGLADCDLNGVPDECEGCIGDFDRNGFVDQHDLFLVFCNWGPCVDPLDCPTDVDCNDETGTSDLLAVLQWWACGVEVVPDGDDPGAVGFIDHIEPYPTWDVFDLYVEFEDPTAVLGYVHSAHITTSVNQFLQHELGNDLPPFDFLVGFDPELAFDSFVTIGHWVTPPSFNEISIVPAPTVFDAAALEGTWMDTSCGSTGNGVPDANGRVFIARLTLENATMWDTIEGEVMVAWISGRGEWKFTKFSLYQRIGPMANCPWDTTGDEGIPDGTVGTDDFFALLQNWGPCPDAPQPCPWDTTGDQGAPDGVIGTDDFFALLQHWGNCGS